MQKMDGLEMRARNDEMEMCSYACHEMTKQPSFHNRLGIGSFLMTCLVSVLSTGSSLIEMWFFQKLFHH